MADLKEFRERMAALHFAPDAEVLSAPDVGHVPGDDLRTRISKNAAALVRDIRQEDRPSLMESFLAEYGLSTDEGVALMCLAEALLRVPDATTMDALIEDKIAPGLGCASGSVVVVAGECIDLGLDADREGSGRRRRHGCCRHLAWCD